jgi:hypothetical protein
MMDKDEKDHRICTCIINRVMFDPFMERTPVIQHDDMQKLKLCVDMRSHASLETFRKDAEHIMKRGRSLTLAKQERQQWSDTEKVFLQALILIQSKQPKKLHDLIREIHTRCVNHKLAFEFLRPVDPVELRIPT